MTDKLNALITLRDKVKAGTFNAWSIHGMPFTAPQKGFIVRAYNGSLDAALFLIDAVLPEWFWCRYADGTFYLEQKVWPVGSNCLGVSANHEIPSRALLLAILDALIAMERNQSLVMRPKESE